ncbi:MAG: M15 family metallopeptidase [Rhodothermales bacterium]
MYIPVNAIRIAQKHLGFQGRAIDGDLGPLTEAALDRELPIRIAALAPRAVSDDIVANHRKRKLIAFLQILATELGVDAGPIDGYWGPQTDHAFDVLEHHDTYGTLPMPWRDVTPDPRNPNQWPEENEAALRNFYGAPGDTSNLVTIDLPYPHRLAWDLRRTTHRLTCHTKVADSIGRVLTAVHLHYGMEGIRTLRLDHYGGCYNKRRKRGGTQWSTHAWGIALDYDPLRNRLSWGRDRATFARPEYAAWWAAWEAEGWVSLGRVANFDWMHVQAARRIPR